MVARSGWQGFDALNEKNRVKMGMKRDTFYYDKNGKAGRIKPTSTLMHERMAKRPFVRFSRFDTETYIDYGRPYYDNNAKIEGSGVNFGGSAGHLKSQKRMADRKKMRMAKKAKVDEYYGKKPKSTKKSVKRSRRAGPTARSSGCACHCPSRRAPRTGAPARRCTARGF